MHLHSHQQPSTESPSWHKARPDEPRFAADEELSYERRVDTKDVGPQPSNKS
jgi:hypothetical protein